MFLLTISLSETQITGKQTWTVSLDATNRQCYQLLLCKIAVTSVTSFIFHLPHGVDVFQTTSVDMADVILRRNLMIQTE